MLLSEVYKDFIDYLNPSEKPKTWAELGLVNNAPESAVKAYKEYLKIEKENDELKKQGIHIS